MVLRSGTKTGSNRVDKRNTQLSKLKSHLPFLCACFKGHGKQRRDTVSYTHLTLPTKLEV